MNYTFTCTNKQCEKYQQTVIISMKISEYTAEGHYCTCGNKLERTIESLVCGYKNDSQFFGKAGMHD